MTRKTKTKAIDLLASELVAMTAETPCMDKEQLVRFSTINEQIDAFGIKVLSGLSRDELLADLLGEQSAS